MAQVRNTSRGKSRGAQQTYFYRVGTVDQFENDAVEALAIDLSAEYPTKDQARQVAERIVAKATKLRNLAKKNTPRMGEGAPLPTAFAWVEDGKVVLARHWAAYGAARVLAKDANLSTRRYLKRRPEDVIAELSSLASELLQRYWGETCG